MKLRIRGNSLRVRLTKTEVEKLANTGYLEEQTGFINGRFVYALQRTDDGEELSAAWEPNKITMYVPAALVAGWPQNGVIGFRASMPVNETEALHLLLEKDFVCLDETSEDQSDNYENPNKTC